MPITVLFRGPCVSLPKKLNFLNVTVFSIILGSKNRPFCYKCIVAIWRWIFGSNSFLLEIFAQENSTALGWDFIGPIVLCLWGIYCVVRWTIAIHRIFVNMELFIIITFNQSFRWVYQEIWGRWINFPCWSGNEKLICFYNTIQCCFIVSNRLFLHIRVHISDTGIKGIQRPEWLIINYLIYFSVMGNHCFARGYTTKLYCSLILQHDGFGFLNLFWTLH